MALLIDWISGVEAKEDFPLFLKGNKPRARELSIDRERNHG